ncbi:MAG: TAXI family TRAP transporter solute-binding subunit [Lachnospiraceae bacterium]|nr:TAXI family TRAP transporter solute-binding subunit [Lachnospiraceae bacterium]
MRNMKTGTKMAAAVLGTVIALTACSAPQLIDQTTAASGEAVETGTALSQEYSFTVGTSSSGGTVYAIGAGLSNLLGTKIEGLTLRAVATGGAVDNINLMGNGEIQISLNAANTNYMAGEGTLAGMEKQENLRGICTLYPSVIHFLVSKDSKITNASELKGTSGCVGAAGSASECYSSDILGFYGYDYKERKDVEPVFTSSTGAVDLFKDGHIEWAFFPLGVPGSNVLDLAMSGKINILPIAGEDQKKLLEQYSYYVPYTIPGGTYQGFDEDIDTIACAIALTVDESVDEEVVYQMTKCIWENISEVQQIADSLKWMTKETAMDGLGVPLHPGAERYYKEIGWI